MSVCLSSLWNKDHTHTPFQHHRWSCSNTIIIGPPVKSRSIAALSPLVALSMRCHGVQRYSKKIKPFTSIKLQVASCYSCKYWPNHPNPNLATLTHSGRALMRMHPAFRLCTAIMTRQYNMDSSSFSFLQSSPLLQHAQGNWPQSTLGNTNRPNLGSELGGVSLIPSF